MKTISPFRRAACFAALSACMATPALAKDSGFYLGVDIGMSKWELDEAEYTAFPIQTGLQKSDGDLAFSVSFGYRIFKFLGAELAFVDMGGLEVTEQGFVQTTPTSVGGFVSQRVDAKGLSLVAVGSLPVGNFEFYGKAGAQYTESTRTIQITSTFGTVNIPGVGGVQGGILGQADSETTEALYAVGVGYSFSEQVLMKFEYSMVPGVGDEDDIGVDLEVQMATLGFQYRF